MVCCDTSFLYSLYNQDAHTERAMALADGLSEPLTLSPFNDFEFGNALRLSTFRRLLSPRDMLMIQQAFAMDLAQGRLILLTCNLALVLDEAKRLSAAHTAASGCRAFDILHVSAAVTIGADHFLSFDLNQRALAADANLKTLD